LAGAVYHYTLFAVTGPTATGALQSLLHRTVDGRVDAPFQYRFLVPCVLVWLNDHAHLSLGTATILVDATAVTVGAAVGVTMLRRSGLGLFALPALLYCALLMLGPILYYKPETMTAFACMTVALLALERRSTAWWSTKTVWTTLVVAALILVGCRAYLLAALGVGFGVRWWQRRESTDVLAALSLLAIGGTATLVLIRVFPDAHYPRGMGLVQLNYNFDALTVCVLGAFLATAIGPLYAVRGPAPIASAVRAVASERLPVLAVIASVVVSSTFFGRIDEIRLIFPIGFALAWVGVDLWRALFSSVEIEERPRSMTVE